MWLASQEASRDPCSKLLSEDCSSDTCITAVVGRCVMPEADDIIAFIVHLWGSWQPPRSPLGQEEEPTRSKLNMLVHDTRIGRHVPPESCYLGICLQKA